MSSTLNGGIVSFVLVQISSCKVKPKVTFGLIVSCALIAYASVSVSLASRDDSHDADLYSFIPRWVCLGLIAANYTTLTSTVFWTTSGVASREPIDYSCICCTARYCKNVVCHFKFNRIPVMFHGIKRQRAM
jgi:hypothetical protein